jgi:hypothetical protein
MPASSIWSRPGQWIILGHEARPTYRSVEARIRELKAEGMGILKIGRTLGIATSVVQRVISAAV